MSVRGRALVKVAAGLAKHGCTLGGETYKKTPAPLHAWLSALGK
jgi:hypothetical protein